MRRVRILSLCLLMVTAFLPALSAAPRFHRMSYAEYEDRVYGAWLGKNIGVLLGEPIEFRIQWSKPGEPFRIAADGEELTNARGWIRRVPDGAHDQDDIYINLLSLEALEKYGIHVAPRLVAERWLVNKPGVWCANAAALNNFKYGIMPPLSGHPAFNDSSTAIDAQIDVDVWGMITPGMIRACGEYTDRAARMTNYGEGAYAAVFIASLLSESFVTDNLERAIAAARQNVPRQSQYWQMLDDVRRWHRQYSDWREARQAFAQKYEKLGGIHALVNSGAVLIGLLYGEKDFERTLMISTLCGWDCDCNPSTAGGILGAMLGAKAIPAYWKDPMQDRYRGETVKAYAPEIALSELARRTAALGERVIQDRGGRVLGSGPNRVLEIPVEQPLCPAADAPLDAAQIKVVHMQVVAEAERDLNGTPREQENACRRLQRLAQIDRGLLSPALLTRVAALADGSDRITARQAALLLGEARAENAARPLLAVAADRGASDSLRVRALDLLGKLSFPETAYPQLAALFRSETDKGGPVTRSAFTLLAKAPEDVLLPLLADLESVDARTRILMLKQLLPLCKSNSPRVRVVGERLTAFSYPEWDAAWTVRSLGPDMNPGMRVAYQDRQNVLCTHPLDRDTPAYLEQTVSLAPGKKHSLEAVVACDTYPGADWELRVFAGKDLLGKQTIEQKDGRPRWQTVRFDLSRYAGETVTLRLENAANGWWYEAGYWAAVRVISE